MVDFSSLIKRRLIPKDLLEIKKPNKRLQKELGGKIDELIWPLVRILNKKGIITFGSCQGGHYSNDWVYYPWVTTDETTTRDRLKGITNTLEIYNAKNPIKWKLKYHEEGMPAFFSLETENKAEPTKLQKINPRIGQYFKNSDLIIFQNSIPKITSYLEEYL